MKEPIKTFHSYKFCLKILCMSLLGDTLVTGSSDHGLRVYNM